MSQLDPVQLTALEFAQGKKGKRAPRGAGSLDRDGYRMIGVKRFYEAEHRIVWRRHKGEIPSTKPSIGSYGDAIRERFPKACMSTTGMATNSIM